MLRTRGFWVRFGLRLSGVKGTDLFLHACLVRSEWGVAFYDGLTQAVLAGLTLH